MTRVSKAEFYDLNALSLKKETMNFSDHQGKVVLVVNTASKCGFTPQFEGLEKLYDTYKDRGFVIFGFPCNQFADQEPGNAASIEGGCVLNYGVTFPMFDKIDVNGKNAHPVFVWLTRRMKGQFGSGRIKWNFTKFLVDSHGQAFKRYGPLTKPEKIEPDIQHLLNLRI